MPKNDQIHFRISSGMKKEIENFAELKGMTLSEFIIHSCYKEAHRVYMQGKNTNVGDKFEEL